MTPDQIDVALSELETRLDRLRALYEQYFMGIERLEPQVPRKDVERRFHELRKTPFRNTARRFKFQTLSQRYSTMMQYWTRICREIENGTYKRHKLRAERAQGGREQFEDDDFNEALPSAEQAKEEAGRDLAELLDSDVDATAELARAVAEASASVAAAPAPAPSTPTNEAGKGLLGRLRSEPKSDAQAATRLNASPGLPPLPPRPGGAPPPRLGELPGAPPRPASGSPASPPPAPSSRPAPPRRSPGAGLPPLPPPRPSSAAGLPPARSPLASVEIDRASIAEIPRASLPELERPNTAVRATQAREAARAAQGGSTGLSEERLRQLHKSYLEARAQTQATAVSFEKLAQNVRDTERKLREQHGGKSVDFEVMVRDGKAILKPRVR